MMHKPEHCFKKCLKEGAASHLKGFWFECNRKEPCPIQADLGARQPFCGTPLDAGIRKLAKDRKSSHGLGNKMG